MTAITYDIYMARYIADSASGLVLTPLHEAAALGLTGMSRLAQARRYPDPPSEADLALSRAA